MDVWPSDRSLPIGWKIPSPAVQAELRNPYEFVRSGFGDTCLIIVPEGPELVWPTLQELSDAVEAFRHQCKIHEYVDTAGRTHLVWLERQFDVPDPNGLASVLLDIPPPRLPSSRRRLHRSEGIDPSERRDGNPFTTGLNQAATDIIVWAQEVTTTIQAWTTTYTVAVEPVFKAMLTAVENMYGAVQAAYRTDGAIYGDTREGMLRWLNERQHAEEPRPEQQVTRERHEALMAFKTMLANLD